VKVKPESQSIKQHQNHQKQPESHPQKNKTDLPSSRPDLIQQHGKQCAPGDTWHLEETQLPELPEEAHGTWMAFQGRRRKLKGEIVLGEKAMGKTEQKPWNINEHQLIICTM